MSLFDLTVGENGLLVELRVYNSFNEQIFADIIISECTFR